MGKGAPGPGVVQFPIMIGRSVLSVGGQVVMIKISAANAMVSVGFTGIDNYDIRGIGTKLLQLLHH